MIYCLNFVKKNMEVFLNRHPHVRKIQRQHIDSILPTLLN